MERKKVYELIDGEREYQNKTFSADQNKATSIAGWILYIEYQLTLAKRAVYDIQPAAAMERIRKATALGVSCMEHNETPER